MANWIKQVNKDIRISDKLCAELTIGKRKVFFNAEDVEQVLTLAQQLHTFMQDNQDFVTDAEQSREAQKAQEYLEKQEREYAKKELKALQAQKERVLREFGPSMTTGLVANIDAKMSGIIAKLAS